MFRRPLFASVLAALLALLPGAVQPVAAQEQTRITFLHTNDNYEIVPTREWGGFAQLMTLLKKERAAAANSIVTTFGGDLLSPSIMSGFHKGAQMIELMNAVGIDVAVPGNHEFDFGPDVFQERVKESKFTWIASNLTRNGRPFDGVADTLLRTYSAVCVLTMGVVVLGDGYTAAQEAQFQRDATAVADEVFGVSPFKEYRDFVNVVGFRPTAL